MRFVLVVIVVIAAGCGDGEAGTTTHVPTSSDQENAPTTHGAAVETTHGSNGGGAVAWPMFRRDANHTAVVPGMGSIDPSAGPSERWRYRVSEASTEMRWFSTFPLGDLDGDGRLEVVVTTADGAPGVGPRVIALTERDGHPQPLWTFEVPNPDGGVDQYGAALADADGDGLPDVVFSSRDGFVRALDGATGAVIWEYNSGRLTESGPMVADLDGDGAVEIIQVTDCLLGTGCAPSGALMVFAAAPGTRDNPPLWQVEFPWKVDSGEPAIADLDPTDGRSVSQIVFGGWGGRLMVVWRAPGEEVRRQDLVLATLDDGVPNDADSVAMRTSPLIADFGDGATAVFGWMPDFRNYRVARLSAVGVQVSTSDGTVSFRPKWTVDEDAWKSSPALLEVGDRRLIATGTGYALGGFGGLACDDVAGRYVARDGRTGELAWALEMPEGQGDLRGSVAIADVDADGEPEVIAGVGCGGRLLAMDGATGQIEWERQLGTNIYVSPSLADLDGDGALEIVVGSLDGNVYVFGG